MRSVVPTLMPPTSMPPTGEARYSTPFIKEGRGRTYVLPGSVLRRRVFIMDPCPERSSGNGANPLHEFSFNRLFLQSGRFKQEKTVQFSRVLFIAKKGTINWSCGALKRPGTHLLPKIEGPCTGQKPGAFFRRNPWDSLSVTSYIAGKGHPDNGKPFFLAKNPDFRQSFPEPSRKNPDYRPACSGFLNVNLLCP